MSWSEQADSSLSAVISSRWGLVLCLAWSGVHPPRDWQDVCQTVERLVRDELDRRFRGRFDFDPVEAEVRPDLDGEPYMRVWIVFDGEGDAERIKDLADGVYGLMLGLEKKLPKDAEGLLLLPAYLTRAEWDELAATS